MFNGALIESGSTLSDRDALITSLYVDGVPILQIAQRAGVSPKTVRNVARRRGIPPRRVSRPERDSEVIARYAAGDKVADIARTFSIAKPSVRAIAARAGLPPRSGWQRRYPLDEAAFDEPTEVGWWLIGLLAADGSINAAEHRVSLCQKLEDADVLRAFYAYVGCPNRPLTKLDLSEAAQARQYPRRPAAEARIFSKRIVAALARHGVVPRKTNSLELSTEAAREPAAWLGLLDGDGSVGLYRQKTYPVVRFFGSRKVIEQCETFWRRSLGPLSRFPRARPHRAGIWVFALGGEKAGCAARQLLRASPVSMKRKRELLSHVAGS